MVSSLVVCPYQPTPCFGDGLDPVCQTMQSTVYQRLSKVGLSERLRLIDGGGAWCKKKVDVRTAVA